MTGRYAAVRTRDGSWTLAHPEHGETLHSVDGAWVEALERYARPCRLRERSAATGRVRLLDVGCGIGLNLAAALAECGDLPLEAVSLEASPEVVRAGLRLPAGPAAAAPFQERTRAALAAALDAPGRPVPFGTGTLELRLGDARRTLLDVPAEPRFEAVFLDPFSPAREGALWEAEFLRAVAERMGETALLSTYSAAMAVRVALVRAGLAVGRGPRVGTKSSGTLASLRGPLPPLDPRTRRRLEARAAREGAAPAAVQLPHEGCGELGGHKGGEMGSAFA